MPQNSFDNIIISDTSCLIALTDINQLELLKKLYARVTITPEIEKEYKRKLPDWIETKDVKNKILVKEINLHLNIGESTAIALANESKNSLLIIDEDRGRKYALNMGLSVTGTLGVLIQAYDKGFIDSREKVFNLMNKLKYEKKFRISGKIIDDVKSQIKPRSKNSRNNSEYER